MEYGTAIESKEAITDISMAENRNLLMYLSSRAINLFGTFIYNFATALYIVKLTGSGTTFALSLILGALPNVILGPLAGSIADRLDRKKITVMMDLLSGTVLVVLLIFSYMYGLKIIYIYITAFMLSTINVFGIITLDASKPNLVTGKKLTKINSYGQMISFSVSLLSPIVGGIVYGVIPIYLFLAINSFSFYIAAFIEMRMDFNLNRQNEGNKPDNKEIKLKTVFLDIKEVLSFLKKQRDLFTIIGYIFIVGFLFNATTSVVTPYIINKVISLEPWQFGIIDGSFSITFILVSLIIGAKSKESKKIKGLLIGFIIMGISFIGIGIPAIGNLRLLSKTSLFIYYLIIFLTLGGFMVGVNIPLAVISQKLTPDYIRGRLNGVMSTLGGVNLLGIILAGVILDISEPYIINFFTGAVIIIMGILLYKNKSMKDI